MKITDVTDHSREKSLQLLGPWSDPKILIADIPQNMQKKNIMMRKGRQYDNS
jgi:hypothetical protein